MTGPRPRGEGLSPSSEPKPETIRRARLDTPLGRWIGAPLWGRRGRGRPIPAAVTSEDRIPVEIPEKPRGKARPAEPAERSPAAAFRHVRTPGRYRCRAPTAVVPPAV